MKTHWNDLWIPVVTLILYFEIPVILPKIQIVRLKAKVRSLWNVSYKFYSIRLEDTCPPCQDPPVIGC